MIAWLRSVAAVLVGHIVFAVGSFAVFRLSHHPPHAPASASFMLVAMAGVLALGAAASLAATLGHGAIWSQKAVLTLMAPAAALGGWLRACGRTSR